MFNTGTTWHHKTIDTKRVLGNRLSVCLRTPISPIPGARCRPCGRPTHAILSYGDDLRVRCPRCSGPISSALEAK